MSTLKRYTGTSWENVGGNVAPKTARTTSTTDTYTCDYINTLSDYSTSETVVGRWIDGKPIYRKVYKITSGLSPDTGNSIDITSLHIGRCIRLDGWTYSSTFGHISLTFYNGNYNFIYLGSTSVIFQYHWDTSEVYIVLEYTKSTD